MTGFYTKPQRSKKVCMNFVALYYFLMSINGYNNFKLFLRIVSVVKIYLITTFQFLPLFFQFNSCSPRKIFWMCNPIWNSLTLNEFFILHGFYTPSQKLHHPKNLSNIFKFFARNVYEDLIFWYQNYLPAEVKCKNFWSKQVISFYRILQNLSLQISDSETYRTQSNIWDGACCEKSQRLKAVSFFRIKLHLWIRFCDVSMQIGEVHQVFL